MIIKLVFQKDFQEKSEFENWTHRLETIVNGRFKSVFRIETLFYIIPVTLEVYLQ